MYKQFTVIFFFGLLSCSLFAIEPFVDDTLKGNVNNRILAFPFFLKSPETNLGFGAVGVYFFKAKKNDREIRTSDINLLSLYTLKEQVVVVLGSTIYFSGEKQIFRWQGSYSYYPDKFWGTGNQSLSEAQEDYSIHQLFFNPQLLQKFILNWYAGINYEYQHITNFNYKSNGVFDQQNIPGRFGGNTSGIGLLLTWDTRNNAYSPSKGSFVELNSTYFSKALKSDFDFNTVKIDFRKFISFSKTSVLGMQLLIKDNSGNAPIRNLGMLGGPEIMRGYYNGRFSDNDFVAAQAELRQFLLGRFGMTVFGGMGEVSSQISELSTNGLHYAWGAGLRIMVSKSEKLNLRIDYGIGKNSKGLYVILKEAF